MSSHSSVDRAPARCSGGHGFNSCQGLRIFLCPTLMSCWLIHLLNYPGWKIWNLKMLVFVEGGKLENPEKTPLSQTRTKNKLNPHMTPGLNQTPTSPHWWEASALTTEPTLLPKMLPPFTKNSGTCVWVFPEGVARTYIFTCMTLTLTCWMLYS